MSSLSPTSYTPELADLMEHEKVIEQGLATFIDVGWALMQIRDGKRYKAAGYSTFEDYCARRWDISRERGRQLIRAAELVDLLPTNVGIPVPKSEAQVRPLAPLKGDPEAAREAWADAVEEAGGQPTAKQVEEAVSKRLDPPIRKPLLLSGVSHPARYSDELFPFFAEALKKYQFVLDPFAGSGDIHKLQDIVPVITIGLDIEPEYIESAIKEYPEAQTLLGDAHNLPWEDAEFDAICTSPTYGNRLADSHNASDPESRRSYTHDLGRPLAENNSGKVHWGPEYRAFHEVAWEEAVRVLRPGGRFVLNIKDHIRNGERQPVSIWHIKCLERVGLVLADVIPVATRSLRVGANADARMTAELVVVMDKAKS
ncbi:MAG TPA: methyltransferase domain-containing protein [Actinomycetota bacterium]|nr:methyltransferase domain-containing protein [Actinomycetota bacterium]